MIFRKAIALMGAAVLVVSLSACNWFSAKPTAEVKKPKPVPGQQVAKPTKVELFN